MSSTHLGGLTSISGSFVLTSVCLSFSACKVFKVFVKSSSADLFADDIFYFVRRGCVGLATVVMSILGSAMDHMEVDSSMSVFRASSIIKHMPTNFVLSCSFCMSMSLSLTWANLILLSVLLESVVVITNNDV
jgi:hypothetical protein